MSIKLLFLAGSARKASFNKKLALAASKMATELGKAVPQNKSLRLAWPVEANEVFIIAPQSEVAHWQKAGVGLYEWPVPEELQEIITQDERLVRLVTNYQTSREELSQFRALLAQS